MVGIETNVSANGGNVRNAFTRVLAVYLPQFHPIPENDSWWGKGFTEWANVAKALPLYRDHYQPRLPSELGFYDLRVDETREAQASLARDYGIHGFCYYHYWFEGKRLLERPFNEVLRSGKPNFPFCICWANETWSRRWLGEERDILIKQTYSDEDDRNHGRWLAAAFADDRYIRIDGRPLFVIYRPMDIPELSRTANTFRETALKEGVSDPFIVGVDAHSIGRDFRKHGLDGTVNFAPQLGFLRGAFSDGFSAKRFLSNVQKHRTLSGDLRLYDYDAAWRLMRKARPEFPHFPMAYVSWDNTARRGRRGIIIKDSDPTKFAKAFREVVASVQNVPASERIVFVNAWNEWAEGNHLEPDVKHGRGYLEALKSVLEDLPDAT